MRQWNKVEAKEFALDGKSSTDDGLEFVEDDKLRDCQATDRNDETRPQNL